MTAQQLLNLRPTGIDTLDAALLALANLLSGEENGQEAPLSAYEPHVQVVETHKDNAILSDATQATLQAFLTYYKQTISKPPAKNVDQTTGKPIK